MIKVGNSYSFIEYVSYSRWISNCFQATKNFTHGVSTWMRKEEDSLRGYDRMEERDKGGRVWIRSGLFRGQSQDGLEMMKKLLASLSAAAGPYYLPCYSLPRSQASSFPLIRRVPKNLRPRSLSILILLFHSVSSVFRTSSSPISPLSLPLLDDLIVRSARESSTSLFPLPL